MSTTSIGNHYLLVLGLNITAGAKSESPQGWHDCRLAVSLIRMGYVANL